MNSGLKDCSDLFWGCGHGETFEGLQYETIPPPGGARTTWLTPTVPALLPRAGRLILPGNGSDGLAIGPGGCEMSPSSRAARRRGCQK